MRNPANIMRPQTNTLRELLTVMQFELPDGYVVFVTDTGRGRCSYKHKTITVPQWAVNNIKGHYEEFHKGDERYAEYYLAHECAHAITFEATSERNHRGTFMSNFMRLCPPELWHHETNYKPGLARAAGIGTKDAQK